MRSKISLQDFLNGAEVSESELLVKVLNADNQKLVQVYMDKHNMHNNTAEYIVSVRKDKQYLDVFEAVSDEIIIDAGGYNGLTALRFINWGGGKVKRIYTFEFDPVNVARCRKNLKSYENIVTLVQKGTWDKDEIIYTSAQGGGGSSALTSGSVAIPMTSIDNTVHGDAVTLIELDVEGAELRTLKGARDTIIKHHPRLAISVYHKPEDIYEIPCYILSLVPEYKFLLRHYCSREWETVLYAYCD